MSDARTDQERPSETTPLLGGTPQNGHVDAEASRTEDQLDSTTTKTSNRRWYSYAALIGLCVLAILVMLLGFFVPDAVQKYAMEATTVELESVYPEFTDHGVRAHIKAYVQMDSSRVGSSSARNLGRFGTWIARMVESGESRVDVSLPDYGDVVLGTAVVPPLRVSVVDGSKTDLNFTVDVVPSLKIDPLRGLFDDWVHGALEHIKVSGHAKVPLRSGILSLPAQDIFQTIDFTKSRLPKVPMFNITRLNFHDSNSTVNRMVADATIVIKNDFPLQLTSPSLNFDIKVDNCLPNEPKITLANATVKSTHIYPKTDISVNSTGYVYTPPKSLISLCPGTGKSPLDTLLGGYIRGHQVTLYVGGAQQQNPDTPQWLTDIITSLTLPIPMVGNSFQHVVKNFTMQNMKFELPDSEDPNDPNSNPMFSGTIQAFIVLPEEMNVKVDVQRVRAKTDVLYKGKKLGELNLPNWQNATSEQVHDPDFEKPLMSVRSILTRAPLHITDEDVFASVVSSLIFGKDEVRLHINANVDVEIGSALGVLTVQEIPAEGDFPVKPFLAHHDLDTFKPIVKSLAVLDTKPNSLTIQTTVDITNPTDYSATIPYLDVHILCNGSHLGNVSVSHFNVKQGANKNLKASATWAPKSTSARAKGRELLSQWLSGRNISITIKSHPGSIPAFPELGRALQRLNFTLPVPKLHFGDSPDDGDGDGGSETPPKFISDATMHLLSSSADFVLHSPLTDTSLFITRINATAFYKENEVGRILYEYEFEVPPGASQTPRLPVDWDTGSVGYDAIKKALGGTLKLKAEADVGVRIGEWEEELWYVGKGIGSKVKLLSEG